MESIRLWFTKVKLFEIESLTHDLALKSTIARENAQRNASSSSGSEKKNF